MKRTLLERWSVGASKWRDLECSPFTQSLLNRDRSAVLLTHHRYPILNLLPALPALRRSSHPLRRLNRRIASNEQRQRGEHSAHHQDQHEGIGQPHRRNMLPNTACWQPGFALAYNYSISRSGHAIAAGSCKVFESTYALAQRGRGGKYRVVEGYAGQAEDYYFQQRRLANMSKDKEGKS